MNIMFKINGEICTPVLNGSILPGITRKSILSCCAIGRRPGRAPLSVDELVQVLPRTARSRRPGAARHRGRRLPGRPAAYQGREYVIGGGKIGPVTQSLLPEADRHPVGRAEDPMHWDRESRLRLDSPARRAGESQKMREDTLWQQHASRWTATRLPPTSAYDFTPRSQASIPSRRRAPWRSTRTSGLSRPEESLRPDRHADGDAVRGRRHRRGARRAAGRRAGHQLHLQPWPDADAPDDAPHRRRAPPCVLHVAARTVGTHAMSIFGTTPTS